MCGIIGYLSKEKLPLEKGLSALSHRGPDAQVIRDFELQGRHMALGHARLSIIDLSSNANQPFSSEDGRFWLILNGEIYNYQTLRTELEGLGYTFRTSSDTEVLLKFLIEYGTEEVHRLQGMFAVVFFDQVEGRIVIIRDQLGIKPIYLYQKEETIIWSSELRGIWSLLGKKDELDPKLWAQFLSAGFMYEPHTGYKNVRKVAPGTTLSLSLKENESPKQEIHRYWNPLEPFADQEGAGDLQDLISNEIESHLVSDVPLGLFFSGGIDSSVLLSHVGNRISSFLVKADQDEVKKAGFSSDFDYGKKIAAHLKADLNIVTLDNDYLDFLDSIAHVAEVNEEPMADYTSLASESLSRKARASGFTVMLSGMGADEIFAGYPRYQLMAYGPRLSSIFGLAKPFFRFSSFLEKKTQRFDGYFRSHGFARKYHSILSPFGIDEVKQMIGEQSVDDFYHDQEVLLGSIKHESEVKKAMTLDLLGFLSHNFLVADKSSMQASIELRVPLATASLFERAIGMNDKELISWKQAKLPLRQYLDDRLPKEFFQRKKAGFHPPIDTKIKALGPDKVMATMKSNSLFDQVNFESVNRLVGDHFQGRVNNTFKVYRLLFLSTWMTKQ